MTGDVADDPTAEVYARAQEMLGELGIPIHAIPGNHDDRDLLAMAFAGREHATGAHAHVLAYVGELRVVGADTSVPGAQEGSIGETQLEWLAKALSGEPARPTLLALHHPPIACGIRAMDLMGLDAADAQRLETLLAANPQVLAVTCGHVHRAVTSEFAGRPLLFCPSTNSTLRLELRAREDLPLRFDRQPLGFAVHALTGGRLVSHVQPLPAD